MLPTLKKDGMVMRIMIIDSVAVPTRPTAGPHRTRGSFAYLRGGGLNRRGARGAGRAAVIGVGTRVAPEQINSHLMAILKRGRVRVAVFSRLVRRRGLPPPTGGDTIRVINGGTRAGGRKTRWDSMRPWALMAADNGGQQALVRRRRTQTSWRTAAWIVVPL